MDNNKGWQIASLILFSMLLLLLIHFRLYNYEGVIIHRFLLYSIFMCVKTLWLWFACKVECIVLIEILVIFGLAQ